MKSLKQVFSVVLLSLASAVSLHAQAETWSASSSISCSGTFEGQYSYAYTYQYVYVSDGYIGQEQHQFQFQGKLQGEKFELRNLSGPHVIYESRNYFLAVPHDSEASLSIRPKFRRHEVQGPEGRRDRGGNQWQVLCER